MSTTANAKVTPAARNSAVRLNLESDCRDEQMMTAELHGKDEQLIPYYRDKTEPLRAVEKLRARISG